MELKPYHHVSKFVSVMAFKGINKDIFQIIFQRTDKDVMRLYNVVDRDKFHICIGFHKYLAVILRH